MPTRKTPQKKRSSSSWKDINQNVKSKPISDVAWKRLVVQRLKIAAAALVVLGSLYGGFRFLSLDEQGHELLAKAGQALPVKFVQVESDGYLTNDWVVDTLGLDGDVDLLRVELAEMKMVLESVAQVKHANVKRQFPDSLVVTIEERVPIARIHAQDRAGDRVTLLVDESGEVFEGIGIDRKYALSLPSLDGIRLKRIEGGYERIEGMDSVDELLREARLVAPHIYKSWRVVSLESHPQIMVRSRNAKEVVFEPGEYRRQLAKLDYILDHYRGDLLSSVSRVDLTLGSHVPVTPQMLAR